MKLSDITHALDKRDAETIREAFRALVDYPNETTIDTTSSGMLLVALKRVADGLAFDAGIMPRGTCEGLGVAPGSSYAQGSRVAREKSAQLARRFADALDRQSGQTGAVAGRAS